MNALRDAYLVEVSASPTGSQFRVTSRQRVLSWERVGDMVLPRVATGIVAKEAFIPTRAGVAMIEYRDEQGARLFMCPLVPHVPPMRERGLRALVKRAAAGAFERGLASEGSTASARATLCGSRASCKGGSIDDHRR